MAKVGKRPKKAKAQEMRGKSRKELPAAARKGARAAKMAKAMAKLGKEKLVAKAQAIAIARQARTPTTAVQTRVRPMTRAATAREAKAAANPVAKRGPATARATNKPRRARQPPRRAGLMSQASGVAGPSRRCSPANVGMRAGPANMARHRSNTGGQIQTGGKTGSGPSKGGGSQTQTTDMPRRLTGGEGGKAAAAAAAAGTTTHTKTLWW